MENKPQTSYPTKEMIEAGAKAAYGTVMCNEEDWPNVSGSVPVEIYLNAAKNCFLAMMEIGHPDEEWKNVQY